MISKTIDRFWRCYSALPLQIRKEAKEAYQLFINNPYHPSLHFKKVHSQRPIFSVRITQEYRALGILQGEEIIWFWVGSHSGYEKLLKEMRGKGAK